ncbi:hypothetical protein [Pseudonocardia pini]|uniref:hypothetical protein n=1 Tax=Pseudonocardia pini TaxID=2758030 RepID=UPI0015F030EC|nr:hypothetical protein [Pseudonocardia pini]
MDDPAPTLVEHRIEAPLPPFDGLVADRDTRYDPDTGHEQVITLRESVDGLTIRLAVDAAACDAARAATRVRRLADEIERIVAR